MCRSIILKCWMPKIKIFTICRVKIFVYQPYHFYNTSTSLKTALQSLHGQLQLQVLQQCNESKFCRHCFVVLSRDLCVYFLIKKCLGDFQLLHFCPQFVPSNYPTVNLPSTRKVNCLSVYMLQCHKMPRLVSHSHQSQT